MIYAQGEAQLSDAADDALARLLQQLATAQAIQPISVADAVPAYKLTVSASEVTLTPLAVAFTSVQAERPGGTPLDVLMDAYDELTTSGPAASLSDAIAHTGPEPSPCVDCTRAISAR